MQLPSYDDFRGREDVERGEVGKKEREKKRRKKDDAGRASSLGPEKLSEIMSEEIGSLARGWLTARSAQAAFFFTPPCHPVSVPSSVPIPGTSAIARTPVPSASRSSSHPSPRFAPRCPAHREKPRHVSFSLDCPLGRRDNPMIGKHYGPGATLWTATYVGEKQRSPAEIVVNRAR